MVQSSRDELLEFFAAQLAIAQPRDDYRELIELSSWDSIPGTRTNAPRSLNEYSALQSQDLDISWTVQTHSKRRKQSERNLTFLDYLCALERARIGFRRFYYLLEL